MMLQLRLFQFFVTLVLICVPDVGKGRQVVVNEPTLIERVKTKGYQLPQEGLAIPRVVHAGNPFKVPSLMPVVTKMQGLTAKSVEPILSSVGTPEICTPGHNGFEKAVSIASSGKSFMVSMPEVVLAKNPGSKDFNPNSFSTFGMIQGLKSNQIRCMLQDRKGNLWFSSDDGVTRYDGKYLNHFVISNVVNKNNIVLSMLEDQSGCLWFGTFGGGVVRFDGIILTQYTEQEGLGNNIVNCIIQDQTGNLWFATSGGGISKFDGKAFTNYSIREGLPGDQIRSLMQDKSGKIWIGTFGNGISCFDGVSFTNYNQKSGFPAKHIAAIFQDKEENIWFGSYNQGFVKFDGKKFYQFTERHGLSNNTILCILQEENGIFWLGTSGGGISRFDGKSFTNFKEEDGLTNNYVRCAIIGRQGNLWFGTRDGGLVRYNKKLFTHYTENEGLAGSKIFGITQDRKGNLWFTSFGGGITCFNGNEFNTYSLKQCFQNSFIYVILEGKSGDMWFGGDGGGITRFDGRYFYQYTQKEGLCSNAVRCMAEDRNRNLWIGTYGSGVSKFDGKEFVQYSEKEGLSSNKVMCLLEDNHGTMWFGTDGGGVTSFDGKRFTRISVQEGLNSSTVTSIAQDGNGNMWFGTSGGGVTRYDGTYLVPLTTKEGLSNNFVTSLRQDREGNLWIGTRSGPNLIRPDQMQSSYDQSKSLLLKTFSYDDGFLGIGCNLNALYEDKAGTFWIGSTNRLTAIRLHDEVRDTFPPNIQLTNMRLFNENIPLSFVPTRKDTNFVLANSVKVENLEYTGISKWYFLPENLSLSYTNNFLSFSYIGISQKQTQKIRYQYKLEGLNDFWSTTTDQTETTYGNLRPGRYCFKVKAMNSEGVWSDTYSYAFSIRYPWWQTWWFYILAVLILLFLIYSYTKWREHEHRLHREQLNKKIEEQTHELKEKNKELEVINEELQLSNSEKDKFFSIIAHDVRGPLSTFVLFTEIMVENLYSYSMDEIQSMAGSMKDSASNLFKLLENLLEWTRMQRGLISYTPEQLNVIEVLSDCIETIHQAAKNKSIAVVVEILPDMEVIADRNMMESIFRNLLSNAIKFTPKGGKVTINAQKTADGLVQISVMDTGIGMSKQLMNDLFRIDTHNNRKGTEGEPSVGLGLLLCKDFVERQNGTIGVESTEGKGSTLYFSLKSAR